MADNQKENARTAECEHSQQASPDTGARAMSTITSRTPERARSSTFRYYIHDGVECFRFQLVGELSEAEVRELTGCWNTARTTLGTRKLLLDLAALKTTDEAGREWLLSMVREGAACVPESYFRDHLGDEIAAGAPSKAPVSRWSRLASFLRGGRELPADPAESSTRAR